MRNLRSFVLILVLTVLSITSIYWSWFVILIFPILVLFLAPIGIFVLLTNYYYENQKNNNLDMLTEMDGNLLGLLNETVNTELVPVRVCSCINKKTNHEKQFVIFYNSPHGKGNHEIWFKSHPLGWILKNVKSRIKHTFKKFSDVNAEKDYLANPDRWRTCKNIGNCPKLKLPSPKSRILLDFELKPERRAMA